MIRDMLFLSLEAIDLSTVAFRLFRAVRPTSNLPYSPTVTVVVGDLAEPLRK